MKKRRRARELALTLLYQVEILGSAGVQAEEVMDIFWEQHYTQDDAVKDFASLIAKEVVRNLEDIDAEIAKTSVNWKLDRMSCIDRNILRMAAFEIIHLEEIPPLVAINEAVELAKKYGAEESSRFINGVLNKIKEAHNSFREEKKTV